ncbi:hypothetical protein JKP88DRAFT_281291 [Tribonema minus]|uniref:EF-hand domain-containing protein n=1 Tax=Tribonema minus TaxID=303371 RepID=A0A835YX15_9STRA|nr:hypothetical protein JKP88DRAFT_281291 [Tribonema minus]
MEAATAAATQLGSGSIEYSAQELSVEDTIMVHYTPPREFFREESGLFYCGGYNGWDGEETPVMVPLLRQRDGRYKASITIPNFAKTLDFTVTDGIRYDMGPDDAFYHIRVTHIREEDDAGNIRLYRQDEDGTLTYEGMIETFDPQELERMIDEGIDKVAENIKVETLSTEEQQAVQVMRAEASILGEKLGLGNMQVSEARDAFDFFDDETTGELQVEHLGLVLDRMGLTLDADEIAGLLERHTYATRPEATTVRLSEYMHMWSELDQADTGIDII